MAVVKQRKSYIVMISAGQRDEWKSNIQIAGCQIHVLMVPSVRIIRNDAGLVVWSDLTALGTSVTWSHAEKQGEDRAQDRVFAGGGARRALIPGQYDR
jgi:hypothetical protein